MPSKMLSEALWRLYHRPQRPQPWGYGGNLPWDDPEFSKRMLREHLTQAHGAASRIDAERAAQIDWFWEKMGFQAGQELLDVTCGPGLYATELAKRGCRVLGIDFAPAAIEYARELAEKEGMAERCDFVLADVLEHPFPENRFDQAILLYGQLAVMPREEAAKLLAKINLALKPGGRLLIELLNQDRVDKKDSTWWYTDENRLFGDWPFLLLGERQWYAEEKLSMERYYALNLESGHMDEITLCDQTYGRQEMVEMLRKARFSSVYTFPEWGEVSLADKQEWIVYIGSCE